MNSEQTTTNVVPDQIQMNEVDLDQMCKRKVIKKGWMRFVVKNTAKDTTKVREDGKGGNLRLKLSCAPLDTDGVAKGPSTTYDLYPPIANPGLVGHCAPDTRLGTYFLCRSLDNKFPRYARRDKDRKGAYITTEGETVDLQKSKAIEREVNQAILRQAVKWWNDPKQLLNETFYGLVEHETDEAGNVYPRISRTRFDPPEDAPIITENFTE